MNRDFGKLSFGDVAGSVLKAQKKSVESQSSKGGSYVNSEEQRIAEKHKAKKRFWLLYFDDVGGLRFVWAEFRSLRMLLLLFLAALFLLFVVSIYSSLFFVTVHQLEESQNVSFSAPSCDIFYSNAPLTLPSTAFGLLRLLYEPLLPPCSNCVITRSRRGPILLQEYVLPQNAEALSVLLPTKSTK